MTLFFLTENDTCDTFKSKDDSSIKLLFCKCELWMAKNTQNHSKIFVQWRLDDAKEGGFNSGLLITDNKTPE